MLGSHTPDAMSNDAPEYADVDYSDGDGEEPTDYPFIQHKIEKAGEVTRMGLEEYGTRLSCGPAGKTPR